MALAQDGTESGLDPRLLWFQSVTSLQPPEIQAPSPRCHPLPWMPPPRTPPCSPSLPQWKQADPVLWHLVTPLHSGPHAFSVEFKAERNWRIIKTLGGLRMTQGHTQAGPGPPTQPV